MSICWDNTDHRHLIWFWVYIQWKSSIAIADCPFWAYPVIIEFHKTTSLSGILSKTSETLWKITPIFYLFCPTRTQTKRSNIAEFRWPRLCTYRNHRVPSNRTLILIQNSPSSFSTSTLCINVKQCRRQTNSTWASFHQVIFKSQSARQGSPCNEHDEMKVIQVVSVLVISWKKLKLSPLLHITRKHCFPLNNALYTGISSKYRPIGHDRVLSQAA